MNIPAYLSLVATATTELVEVRTKLEQAQARIGGVRCAPIFASPIGWDCDGVDVAFMPDELKDAFDDWLAVIGGKLAHPPGDDA
ncbi:MAG: hypothetical protein R6X35_10535 [Candidatus Krumholzibacteriia bacterium]